MVGVGIAVFLGWALNQRDFRGFEELLFGGGLFVLLVLLGVIGGLMVPLVQRDRRSVGSTLPAGCLVMFCLVMCGIALFIVFFISCAANFRL
jgi:hypothetical protein